MNTTDLADRIVGPPIDTGLDRWQHEDAYGALNEIEAWFSGCFTACAAELSTTPVPGETLMVVAGLLDDMAKVLGLPGPIERAKGMQAEQTDARRRDRAGEALEAGWGD